MTQIVYIFLQNDFHVKLSNSGRAPSGGFCAFLNPERAATQGLKPTHILPAVSARDPEGTPVVP
jgi:hypothetical protein